MKTAIYAEDGVVQVVLTPESEWEQDIIRRFGDAPEATVKIMRGSFYECRGGWNRVKFHNADEYGQLGRLYPPADSSLILRIAS